MDVVGFNVTLYTDNAGRLVSFYRDVVGLTFNEQTFGFDFGDSGALHIDEHSEISGPTKEPARAILNLFVADIVAEQARLEAAGVEFSRTQGREPWGGIISTFNDPDGNYIQLIQFDPGG